MKKTVKYHRADFRTRPGPYSFLFAFAFWPLLLWSFRWSVYQHLHPRFNLLRCPSCLGPFHSWCSFSLFQSWIFSLFMRSFCYSSCCWHPAWSWPCLPSHSSLTHLHSSVAIRIPYFGVGHQVYRTWQVFDFAWSTADRCSFGWPELG